MRSKKNMYWLHIKRNVNIDPKSLTLIINDSLSFFFIIYLCLSLISLWAYILTWVLISQLCGHHLRRSCFRSDLWQTSHHGWQITRELTCSSVQVIRPLMRISWTPWALRSLRSQTHHCRRPWCNRGQSPVLLLFHWSSYMLMSIRQFDLDNFGRTCPFLPTQATYCRCMFNHLLLGDGTAAPPSRSSSAEGAFLPSFLPSSSLTPPMPLASCSCQYQV